MLLSEHTLAAPLVRTTCATFSTCVTPFLRSPIVFLAPSRPPINSRGATSVKPGSESFDAAVAPHKHHKTRGCQSNTNSCNTNKRREGSLACVQLLDDRYTLPRSSLGRRSRLSWCSSMSRICRGGGGRVGVVGVKHWVRCSVCSVLCSVLPFERKASTTAQVPTTPS